MMADSPHSEYPHVYVVLRVDDFSRADAPEDRVAAVSTFVSWDAAEREAKRLNAFHEDRNLRYVVLTSRLKE